MRNTKLLKIFAAILLVAIMSMNSAIIFASATEDNMSEVVANGYYRHPITGIIEDSGGESSAALGQSMVMSVAPTVAMLEEVDGKYYVTFSFNLMNSISDVEFQVQQRGDSDWEIVTHEIISTGDDVETFKIEIPTQDAIVRASAFVVPMGRSVVFYMDFIESDTTTSTSDDTTTTTTTTTSSSSSSDFESLLESADDVITSLDIDFGSDTDVLTDSSQSVTVDGNSVIIDDSVWLILLAYIFCGNVLSGVALFGIYMLIKKIINKNTVTKADDLNDDLDVDLDKQDDEADLNDDFSFDDLEDFNKDDSIVDVWSDSKDEN